MKFLLVEDEVIQLRLIKDAISKAGNNEVSVCSSGQVAIELLKNEHFDLIIMDIHLSDPAMNGIAAARVVHEFYGVPVVFLTADDTKETVDDAVAAGSFGYIIKSGPITSQQSAYQAIIGVALHNYEREEHACKDFIVCVDTEGKIVFMNWMGETLLGYEKGTWRGKNIVQHLGPNSAAAWKLCSVEMDIEPELPQELELLDPEGEQRIFELETTQICVLGRRLGLRLVGRDVTERRSFERTLRDQEQMRAIGQMTAGFVHDLRSPLTAIMIGMDRLPANIKPGVESSVRRMKEMIESMLKFARGIQETPQCIDLYKVIRASTIDFDLSRDRKISLDVESCQDDLNVLAHDLDLRRAFLNLYKNAQEAIQQRGNGQGAIMVEMSRKEITRNSSGNGESRSQSYAQIVVRDNGKGMSKETRERLFTPFFTTKGGNTGQEGNGVGLMNVKGAVERCGGFIEVESEMDKGTQFIVHLPLAG